MVYGSDEKDPDYFHLDGCVNNHSVFSVDYPDLSDCHKKSRSAGIRF